MQLRNDVLVKKLSRSRTISQKLTYEVFWFVSDLTKTFIGELMNQVDQNTMSFDVNYEKDLSKTKMSDEVYNKFNIEMEDFYMAEHEYAIGDDGEIQERNNEIQ